MLPILVHVQPPLGGSELFGKCTPTGEIDLVGGSSSLQTIQLGRIMLIVTHSLKLHPVCKLAGRSYSGSSHTSSYKHWLQIPTGFVYALGDSSMLTP